MMVVMHSCASQLRITDSVVYTGIRRVIRWRSFRRLLLAEVVVAIVFVGSQLLLFEIRSMRADELPLICARRLST